MKIIRKAELVVKEVYVIEFRYENDLKHGFIFECDKNGNIIFNTEKAKENFEMCLLGVDRGEIIYKGIKKETKKIYKPALGICPYCGEVIALDGIVRCHVCSSIYDNLGREILFI